MSRPLPPSRLGIVKDAVVLAFVVAFLAVLLFFILPSILSVQLETVERRYFEEQEILVRRTVADTAHQIADLDARLSASGLAAEARDSILLAILKDQRFGVGASGYFFVFTTGGDMLLHPAMPELIGQNLRNIISPDGINMGTLLLGALADRDTVRVEYRWNPPDKTVAESKTTFLQTIPRKRWVLASGFYRSDFQPTHDAFLTISTKALAEARFLSLTAALILTLAGIGFAFFVFWRVRATERALERRTAGLEQYKRLLDKSSLVSRTTPEGIITAVNDTFCEVTGYKAADVIGHSHNVERHPDTPLEVFRELWAVISAGQVWQGTLKNRKADGSSYLKRATIVPITDEKGRIVEFLSSGQDVTEVFENRGKLQIAFMTDPLTSLGNRSRLLAELDALPRPGVILVDAVGFSGINAVFGPEGGDHVLKTLALTLLESTGGWTPRVYRLHSDTFALAAGGQDAETFSAVVRGLADRLGAFAVELGGQSVPVALRFGAACADRDVLVWADEALARARATRSRVVLHEASAEGPGADLQQRLQVLHALRWALDHDRVFAIFQPLMNLSTGEIEKYECLMRVESPDGRVLLPGEFMEISKKTRVYQSLSQRLFRVGMAAAQGGGFDFSINLTMEDLLSAETMEFLLSEAHRTDTARRLIVEFVETEELESLEQSGKVFDDLRAAGIRLAVDDFGSGYASFDYLLKLNPSFVKIDGSIVQKMASDPRARELVSSIVSFARKSGIRTVAEYLDTAELVDLVRSLGVDYGQGWFIGRGERLD